MLDHHRGEHLDPAWLIWLLQKPRFPRYLFNSLPASFVCISTYLTLYHFLFNIAFSSLCSLVCVNMWWGWPRPFGSQQEFLSGRCACWWVGKGKTCSLWCISYLSPYSGHLGDACKSAGVAAYTAECRKHSSNDPKCQELGWVCIPLVVETYHNWGKRPKTLSHDGISPFNHPVLPEV